MKTQLLYIIVSSDNDIYLEQAYISMYSAKKYNDRCNIVVLTDKDTQATFIGKRKQFISLADDIISIDLSHIHSPHHRSRILKTGARKYVSGDFLFIDTDTIILNDLSEIDNLTYSIAACIDSHSKLSDNPYRSMILSHVKSLGLDISNEEVYFNSGVIYSKDDDISHDFYSRWQNLYEIGRKTNVAMDQPSFCVADHAMNKIVKTLPDIWTCELKHGMKFLNSALILHYLCTNISKTGHKQIHALNEKEYFTIVKETGEIPDIILKCIENPFIGLNTPSTLVTGVDNLILRSRSYSLIKEHPFIFNILEKTLALLGLVKSGFRFVLKF